MKNHTGIKTSPLTRWLLAIVAAAALFLQGRAIAFTLRVVDGGGNLISSDFRWLVEMDNTARVVPGAPANDTPSVVMHKSHAPVVLNGMSTTNNVKIQLANTNRYIVSVMADGYSLGGQNVAIGQSNVTVILNRHPIPTAQISILAFNDNNPINNAPDATEEGLAGFLVVLADLGGGPIMQDVFGNPLGTTYQTDGFGEYVPDANTTYAIDVMGNGNIYTDANGKALIKNLPMGKFGVRVIPPSGTDWTAGHAMAKSADKWHQTATIEGSQTVDAWVKANEPTLFMEGFGSGSYHVFFGFVDPSKMAWASTPPPVAVENMTIKGTNIFNHFGRPPTNQMFAPGPAVGEAWVGLNEMGAQAAAGRGLYIAPCNADGSFVITNVPPGTYQLVTWDTPLDALFGFNTIVVTNSPGGIQDLGNVLSYRWFGTYEGSVFYDANENGFREENEQGIPQQTLNLRFRDGTVYMSTVTDEAGDYQMQEVFPFFKWLVAEVDFARFKATGMTAVTDEGGFIPPDDGWNMPSEGVRTPQPQFETDPITGLVLTNGFGQPIALTNANTGNNLSRTEIGPVLTEAMQIYLNQNNRIDWGKANYQSGENGGISGIVFYGTTRAENDPRFATGEPWESGIPRVQVALYSDANSDRIIDDLNGDGVATMPDVDNAPREWTSNGVKGAEDVDYNDNGVFDAGDAIQITWTDSWDDLPPTGSVQLTPPWVLGKPIIGNDNYSTWNQIRPGVFDGGYLFAAYYPGGMANNWDAIAGTFTNQVDTLPPGNYIVHAVPPPGYEIQKEEDKNVDFGDSYIPSKLLLAPECVGTTNNGAPLHIVPPYLTLFPDQQVPAAFAGEVRPLADRKIVTVAGGKNTACDFHMFTAVPKAARAVGFVLNDLTAEFNANSPIYGEKGSPGWLPISFRDWAGHEVARVYSDEFGTYEAMLPSTYSVAIPAPSGVSPNMLTLILNDPTMPDPSDATGVRRIADPHYNPNFSVTPWTLHYYPGTVTYLDTPIVPVAGFVGYPNKQLDIEPADGTPVIKTVTANVNGPYITSSSQIVTITAMGPTPVPNPDLLYNATNTITRDYGFGVSNALSKVVINGVAMRIVSWTTNTIRVRLPVSVPSGNAWQLMVTRGDNGNTTPIGITLSSGSPSATIRYVSGPVAPTAENPYPTPIQDAIDAAAAGSLVLVGPGVYNENPILWKGVRLQGAGAGTIINANPTPAERLAAWHGKVLSILGGDPFQANECPGILVVGGLSFTPANAPRIDGFEITGSISGGGISVFEDCSNLRISNNRIIGNQGEFAGGIALGMGGEVGVLYQNANVTIDYNQILKNGGVNGPGGVAIYNGATGYKILNNQISGNFSRSSGGGIGHLGCSPGGLIAHNVISFNEVFFGVTQGGDGGGIYITGETPVAGALSPGAGSVTIINNLIQGNLAGSGNGGGIRVSAMNGGDVEASSNPANWYALDILNNIIVNNVSGYSGGGISLQDASRVRVIHNTVALNDSVATAKSAFLPSAAESTAQGAGIVTYAHGALLAAASGQAFCSPDLLNNIVWHNRSFAYDSTNQRLTPDLLTPTYWDLEVSGTTNTLSPTNCLLSDLYPGGAGNLMGNPDFVNSYANTLFTSLVVDEGGNSISVRFEPAGLRGDYHLLNTSVAINNALSDSPVAYDYDHQARRTSGQMNPAQPCPVR